MAISVLELAQVGIQRLYRLFMASVELAVWFVSDSLLAEVLLVSYPRLLTVLCPAVLCLPARGLAVRGLAVLCLTARGLPVLCLAG